MIGWWEAAVTCWWWFGPEPQSVHPRSSLFGWHCVLSKIFSCRKAVHLWWRNRGGTWKEAADECPIQPVEWKCQRKYQGLVLVVPPLLPVLLATEPCGLSRSMLLPTATTASDKISTMDENGVIENEIKGKEECQEQVQEASKFWWRKHSIYWNLLQVVKGDGFEMHGFPATYLELKIMNAEQK